MKFPETTPQLMVGVDLGGTKILAAVVAADGTVLTRSKRPTLAELGADEVTDRILETIREAATTPVHTIDDVIAIGIGSPGPLDPETGVIIKTPNLAWENFPLGARLAESIGKPVFVDNDVTLGTFGEVRFGAGRGADTVVGLFVGTGIGGAILIGGRIHHGAGKNAGEIGHQVIIADGPRCGCGVRGCLEAVASRSAIERALRKKIRNGTKSALEAAIRKGKQLTSRDLLRAYDDGDKLTRDLVDRAATYIGIGIGNLLNVFSPDRVIVGGGVAEAFGEPFLERVRRSARKHSFPVAFGAAHIVLAELGDDAGVMGAAAMARDRLERTGGPPSRPKTRRQERSSKAQAVA